MKRLDNFNLNRLKNKQWYHQRFDGCPMFIGFISESEPKRENRKPKGTEADIRACYFEEGKCDWYLDMKDIGRATDVILKLAKKDSKISTKFLAAWRKDEQAFEDFCLNQLPKIDFKKLLLGDLLKLWEHYRELGINRFTSSSIIDHFALGTDRLIADMLKAEISKIDKNLTESDFAKIFAVASAPTKQSFYGVSEINLLKIILNKSKQTLKEHQQKYFWLNNNYIRDRVLTVDDFKKEVKAWKTSGKDLAVELRRLKETPIKNKKIKERLFKKYKLSQFLYTLLKISDDFTWWQDERKKATYLNIHAGCQILAAIAKLTGYMLDELKYASPCEIAGIIKKKFPKRRELRERMNGSACVATRDEIIFATGKKVARIRQIMFGRKKFVEIDDFRGLTASPGKATGRVKVIKSSTEIGKVKVGDILEAVMTRPDYVVAMKKAAAIVTNEGGITSHAAIISRELGIPCIIGTKIATEVLRDGDLVEVNANHGVVRMLKRKKIKIFL